jgi:AraC-like DNA-binding protein
LNESDTSYVELPPPPELAASVACLWYRTGSGGQVLPDGCVDVVWTGRELIVAGPATRAVVPDVAPEVPKLGLRFRVGVAGAALGLPATELLDQSPSLAEVMAAGEELIDHFAAAGTIEARFGVLCEAMTRRRPVPDPLVRAATRRLARPRSRVADLSDELGLSERQLRRRVADASGYSPRTLARVLRFQRFLALAREAADLAWLAADAGYADQSHLTRDCVEFAGMTPVALLATNPIAAGERFREK